MKSLNLLLLLIGTTCTFAHEEGPKVVNQVPLTSVSQLELDYFSTKLKTSDAEYTAAVQDGIALAILDKIDRVVHTIYQTSGNVRTKIIEYIEIAPNGGLNTSFGPAFALVAGAVHNGVYVFIIHTSPIITARVVEMNNGVWTEVQKKELTVGNVEKYDITPTEPRVIRAIQRDGTIVPIFKLQGNTLVAP